MKNLILIIGKLLILFNTLIGLIFPDYTTLIFLTDPLAVKIYSKQIGKPLKESKKI